MKDRETFTEWTERMTNPEGSDFLFAFVLGLWSWHRRIPAAMLWLLRLSSNGLQFTSIPQALPSPREPGHTRDLNASWESKQRDAAVLQTLKSPVSVWASSSFVSKGFNVPQISLLKWAHPSIIQLLIWLLMAVPLWQNGARLGLFLLLEPGCNIKEARLWPHWPF